MGASLSPIEANQIPLKILAKRQFHRHIDFFKLLICNDFFEYIQ